MQKTSSSIPPPQRVAVFTKTYALTCRWYGIAKKFPKPDRYTLGNQLFALLLQLLTGITQAEYLHGAKKRTTLEALSPTLDTIKILVRLSRTLGIIEMPQYIAIEEQCNAIGNMLGGWIRSLPHDEPPRTRV